MPFPIALPGLLLAVLAATGPLWIYLPILKVREQMPRLRRSLPWIRSVGLPYLAIVAGWVSMRDFGLVNQTSVEWLAGMIGALALAALGGWLAIRFRVEVPALSWIQDETRWTLYRAVTWPLFIFLPLAVLAAGLVAALEAWLENRLQGKSWNWLSFASWLIRAAASSALFLMAHNLYLALGMYLVVWLIIKNKSRINNS